MHREDAFEALSHIRHLRRSLDGHVPRGSHWLLSPDICGFGVGTRNGSNVVEVFLERTASARATAVRIPARIVLPGCVRRAPLHVTFQAPVRVLAGQPTTGTPASDISRSDQGWSGTAACRVRWRGNPGSYLLSNAHVLAMTGLNAPIEGDPIIHPSFGRGGNQLGVKIAELANWTRFSGGADFPNVADAAIARLVSDHLPGVPQPSGINTHLFEQMPVRFFGAASGRLRTGTIQKLNVCRELPYKDPGGTTRTYGFCGLVDCTTGADDGDSGSIVVDSDGLAVGLLFAGSSDLGVFTPIQSVFDLLDLELDTPDSTDSSGLPVPPMPPLGFKPQVQHSFSAIDILARTLFGEARSEPMNGIIGVAAVVANRTHAQRLQWGLTVEEVCKMPKQFSCWNTPVTAADTTNQKAMLEVGPETPVFIQCVNVARQTLSGEIVDPTHGANHYFNPAGGVPSFAVGVTPTRVIGRHTFLRL
jgi:N-acetylmuramoyl-L-alanine amidase